MPTESVRVVVRKRPLNSSEKSRANNSIVKVDRELRQVSIQNGKSGGEKNFTFDAVYDDDSSQNLIYTETAFPLVDSVIQGYNGTIFAYGQTGCGKTFTMVGVPSDPELAGIIPNSFSHIFGTIAESQHEKTFLVQCSYIEIYNEDIRDLLFYDPMGKLELKEDKNKGIFIKNLSLQIVKTVQDIESAMESGNSHRVTKETQMNARSSRSHAIFTIYIETSETIESRQVFKAGKLNLVDLAGSERQKKTGAVGETLKEAIEINLSLSALGNVISALVDSKSSHIPFRDSKLTRLLQDSLGGNTKTVMIAVVSPADYNYDESLSTLRYAGRAKFIQNKPKVNEDPKDALLRQYADEIAHLKRELGQRQCEREGVAEPPAPQKTVQIEKQLSVIKDGILQGGEVEQEKLKQQRAFRKKLKKQKQREQALLREKREKEELLLEKEHHYNDLQEEVEGLKTGVHRLRQERRDALFEIEDLNHEFALEKEGLLENVRELEYECDFLAKVLKFVVPCGELETIRLKSKFDSINNSWKVPPFVIQGKQAFLPKINKSQANESIFYDLKNKTIAFQDANECTEELRNARFEDWNSPKKQPARHRPSNNPETKRLLPLEPHVHSHKGLKLYPAEPHRKNKNHVKLEPIDRVAHPLE